MQQATHLSYETALRNSMDRDDPHALSITQQHVASDRDRRFRYFAVSMLAAVALLAMCCARAPIARTERARPLDELSAAVAELRVRCVAAQDFARLLADGDVMVKRAGEDVEVPYGSGVLVSPTQLLTAAHVADVSGIPPILTACSLYAYFPSGRRYQLAVDHLWPDRDVARMRAAFGVFYEFRERPAIAAPVVGEDVCLEPAIPMRLHRCGEVQSIAEGGPGNVVHLAITEHGNSGGGAYDRRGRLVGITTHLWNCSNGQICGGRITSMRAEFLP